MFDNQRNSKKQGDVGLGNAISWACKHGFTVAIPLTDSQDYDLIIDQNGKLLRVQVKTTRYFRKGCYVVSLSVNGGNRSGTGKTKKLDVTAVDAIFVLCENGDEYFIPVWDEMPRTGINLSSLYSKYKL